MSSAPERNLPDTVALFERLEHPDEHYIFDALGAFAPSGAPLSVIAEVTGLSLDQCERTFSVLKSHFLVRQDEGNPYKYKLDSHVYGFAQERLREREHSLLKQGGIFQDLVTGRMIRFYVEHAFKHRDDFPVLESDRDNIIQAALSARDRKAWEAVHDLWEALDLWLDITGDWSTLYYLLEGAVEANFMLENREWQLAKTLDARSTYFDLTGQITKSLSDATRSLELGYKTGDHKIIASSLVRLGNLYDEYFEDSGQAHSNFEEAWKICQNFPEWEEAPFVAYQLALSHWSRGDTAVLNAIESR